MMVIGEGNIEPIGLVITQKLHMTYNYHSKMKFG